MFKSYLFDGKHDDQTASENGQIGQNIIIHFYESACLLRECFG